MGGVCSQHSLMDNWVLQNQLFTQQQSCRPTLKNVQVFGGVSPVCVSNTPSQRLCFSGPSLRSKDKSCHNCAALSDNMRAPGLLRLFPDYRGPTFLSVLSLDCLFQNITPSFLPLWMNFSRWSIFFLWPNCLLVMRQQKSCWLCFQLHALSQSTIFVFLLLKLNF